jgi:hypothetical protein
LFKKFLALAFCIFFVREWRMKEKRTRGEEKQQRTNKQARASKSKQQSRARATA